jgi:4-alpha-glucanotransferase
MRFPRSAGILLHVTSLPGAYGIGDLGDEALRFVDFLVRAGQRYWQVLPLGPTSDGSPYVALSSWAGSPSVLSLDALVRAGDLRETEVGPLRVAPARTVSHTHVAAARAPLLRLAAERFFARTSGEARVAFDAFCAAESPWLDDWALFAALRTLHQGAPWWTWPEGEALRDDATLRLARATLEPQIDAERYAQFRFFEQWGALREHAARAGVHVIGDVPIYCAADSADVWAARHVFRLDARGRPTAVSGVPPDYFAEDGQLWGTPVFDWEACEREGFRWWIARLRAALRLADTVRIDHFRAFESYWEVPADATTARAGRWVPSPGDAFFGAVRAALGEPPFIAEDLGVITEPVRALRDRWKLPGMRVLQFAFSEGSASPHVPYHHVPRSVVYTGTHDNDTTVGWFEKASPSERDLFRRMTASSGDFCHYHMIRLAYGSVSQLAIVPMQDVLGQGSASRMNTPGRAAGNWTYKIVSADLSDAVAEMLHTLAGTFGRLAGQEPPDDSPA